jgi:hypothetical protein
MDGDTAANFASAAQVLRSRPDLQKFKATNKLLNGCDTYKDAKQTKLNIVPKNKLFENTVKKLYGTIVGWDRIKDRIIKDIKENEQYGPTEPFKVCWVENITQAVIVRTTQTVVADKEVQKNLVSKIPGNITTVVHDSGNSPLKNFKGLSGRLTPGSFIDPAGRTKLDDKYVKGVGVPLTQEVLDNLGFGDAILEFATSMNERGMKCVMKLPNKITVTSERSREHEHVESSLEISGGPQMDTDIDFFGGNPDKNAWFNENDQAVFDMKGNPTSLEAVLYALCKELGDTLQVLYVFMTTGGKIEPSVCMFTGDDVVLARCRELNIACCCQDHEDKVYDNLGKTNYWSPHFSEADVEMSNKNLYARRCNEENTKTISSIDVLLSTGAFTMTGEQDQFAMNDDIRAFFVRIKEAIKPAPSPLEGESSEAFLKRCLNATALKIVDGTKILTSAARLFTDKNAENDPIRVTKKSLGQHLKSISSSSGRRRERDVMFPPSKRVRYASAVVAAAQQGGGEGTVPENSFMQDFYEVIEYIASVKLDGKSVEDIEDYSYDFLCIMTIYLNYVRYSCLDEGVLAHFFQRIMLEGVDYDLDEFAAEFFSQPIVREERIFGLVKNNYIQALSSGDPAYLKVEGVDPLDPVVMDVLAKIDGIYENPDGMYDAIQCSAIMFQDIPDLAERVRATGIMKPFEPAAEPVAALVEPVAELAEAAEPELSAEVMEEEEGENNAGVQTNDEVVNTQPQMVEMIYQPPYQPAGTKRRINHRNVSFNLPQNVGPSASKRPAFSPRPSLSPTQMTRPRAVQPPAGGRRKTIRRKDKGKKRKTRRGFI